MLSQDKVYRCAFEASINPIVLFDGHTGRILDVNPAAIEFYGYEKQEALGLNLTQLCKEETLDPSTGDWAVPLLTSHINRAGAALPVDVSIGSFALSDQQMGVMIIRDMREQLRLETEREELKDQLRHIQKMEALGRLAGGVAHDFRNELTIITLSCELVKKQLQDAAVPTESVSQIRRAAERAASLTERLLSFAHKDTAHTVRFDLRNTVEEIASLVERTIGRKIKLTINIAPGPFQVEGDPGQMTQVLLNLVLNARDALLASGEIAISLVHADGLDAAAASPEQSDRPAGARGARLEVRDNGVGMSDDIKARVCEPFFTTKAPGKGTGLGLSMAYAAVTQAGGEFRIESSPGNGTSVQIYLPTAG